MRVAVRIDVTHGAVLLPLVGEGSRQNRPILHIHAVLVQLLVADRERIPWPDIQHEINVPTEDVGERNRGLVVAARVFDRLEQ